MPHEDGNIENRPSERRHRLKSERDPTSSRKTRSSRPKIIDPETGELVRPPHRKRREKEHTSDPEKSSTVEMISGPLENERRNSVPGTSSRSSLPYPSFSKAHSRESVNSKVENATTTVPSPAPVPKKTDIYTPDSTDVGGGRPHSRSHDSPRHARTHHEKEQRPPSPPETEVAQKRAMRSTESLKATRTPSRTSQIKEEALEDRPRRTSSSGSQRSWFGRPKVEIIESSRVSSKSKSSKASTAVKSKDKQPSVEIVADDGSEHSDVDDKSAIDSNATSIAPPLKQSAAPNARPPGLDADDSPESNHDSSPRTPTATPHLPSHTFKSPPPPSPFVSFDIPSRVQSAAYESPMPPPPPPPPEVPMDIPRVDYLLQNGGLRRPVPRSLILAAPQQGQQYPPMGTPAPPELERVFGPFYSLLDEYESVIHKNGSIAVATGYRSVARRLLDRLEVVFNRELPGTGCDCILCRGLDRTDVKAPGWGDILEAVSGRREIPVWPAMNLVDNASKDNLGLGLGGGIIGQDRPRSPVKIDPDIAEEFHQHYLKQSKKTKASVDKWLNSTPETIAAPPPDVDDETLTFTILTHLQPSERPMFNALIAGSALPVDSMSRAPTPGGKPRADFVVRASLALQRLYRLSEPPRDPEIAVYLLRNPQAHPLLLSLYEINNSEWEILISGRFDGFLWSGSEAEFPGSMLNSPAATRMTTPAQGVQSRGPTPFSPNGLPIRGPSVAGRHSSFSRGTTPFSAMSRGTPSQFAPTSVPGTPFGQNRQAVSQDEENEIAVLAELEREIYVGMEALEDAFEVLHRKAETVRSALRQRGAGLSMMAQTRMGAGGQGVYTRLATPSFGERGWDMAGSEVDADIESEWGGDDTISEIAPDDSASNISSSRHRRPKRRTERRTPAPVEEEDEN